MRTLDEIVLLKKYLGKLISKNFNLKFLKFFIQEFTNMFNLYKKNSVNEAINR